MRKSVLLSFSFNLTKIDCANCQTKRARFYCTEKSLLEVVYESQEDEFCYPFASCHGALSFNASLPQ